MMVISPRALMSHLTMHRLSTALALRARDVLFGITICRTLAVVMPHDSGDHCGVAPIFGIIPAAPSRR